MKKSLWGVMLTLAALVMMLGASSVAFATVASSGDVKLSFDVSQYDYVLVSQDSETAYKDSVELVFTDIDKATDLSSAKILSSASKDLTIYYTSKDIADFEIAFKVLEAKVSDDSETDKKGTSDGFAATTAFDLSNTTNANFLVSSDKNFATLTVSADGWSGDITLKLLVQVSPDASATDAVQLAVALDLHVKPSFDVEANPEDASGAFDSVTITATDSSSDTFTVSVVSTDVSFDFTSPDYATVSGDLKDKSSSYTAAAGSISFALTGTSSASVKAVYAVSGDTVTTLTASSSTYTSTITENVTTTFVFVFTSGDYYGGVKFDVKGSSSSSSEKTIDDIADEETAAAVTEALTELGWTTDQQTAYATELVSVLGENAKITGITSTDNGIAILNITDGTNEYAGIPAVNGKIVVAVDSAGNVTGLPSYVTPAKLADEFATLTGQSTITSISTFYSRVFPTTFFTDNTPAVDPADPVEGENGGITSFEGTLGAKLPYGTIILVYLLPTDEDTTASAIQGVMVHTGALKERSEKIAFALADVQDISGSAMSDITIPVTEPYNIGYSTPDGGNTFSGESVEDGSFGVAATTTGDSGSLASELTLDGDTAAEVEGSNKGSSSGCDTGFGALALLALALPLVKKFSK